ncbi:TBC1 domain family member 7 [Amyelois transitella]|uniref:TBC1 domain family member 7 n=1 Tax=Amyelois transitella TaxID=680683 RepID=UPI00298F8FB6|nr:TBC1 domain family member 7 [Amyelois transitella]XP_060806904.1 TBC1 domain family member 7 [Amyelois transitella]XP_060806905.1 TBC1 domain family member 7 [Amyelois transitella]
MADERNFRSSYYEKVGCRGVEEKKSLEILMKEKPWDRVKLKQFCQRFTVPVAYRNLVWKVLLDILPVYPEAHQYVMTQREEQYHDLLHAVQLLERINMDAPRSKILYEMWLIEKEERKPIVFPETNFSSADTFIPIAETLLELDTSEVDIYWITKNLTDIVRGMQKEVPKLKETFLSMLEKEDEEVYIRLSELDALEILPLMKWINCCFAGILDDTSLPKIWDKVCSGAPKILLYTAVMLVITLRNNILKAKAAEEVFECFSEIPEQYEEQLCVVANKAIDLWQHYGALSQNEQIIKK